MGPVTIYVGYDPSSERAYNACVGSMRRFRPGIVVRTLDLRYLRAAGWYWRTYSTRDDGTMIDHTDGRPFSTEFSFTRFLVPYIQRMSRPAISPGVGLQAYGTWAMYVDADFLWRGDVLDVFSYADPTKAAVVVKHDHRVIEGSRKMRGQVQSNYPRKNWSSLILWNCDHPANRVLTPDLVCSMEGSYLHGLGWLRDDQIGGLPPRFNFLVGHQLLDEGVPCLSVDGEPVVGAHFTEGTPDMAHSLPSPFDDEWWEYARSSLEPVSIIRR